MRGLALILLVAGTGPAVAWPAAPVDPTALEAAWHACLREATVHQPRGQSHAGDQRNALDECRTREDAYVAALMAAGPADATGRPTAWARARATVVEPLSAWLDVLRR